MKNIRDILGATDGTAQPVSDEPTDEVERWNRPFHAIKQVEDGMESIRVFLETYDGRITMLEWARAVYLRFATRDGIAADYAAISSMDDVYRFLDKHDCPAVEDGLSAAQLEEAVKQGLVTAEQADEMRELLQDLKEKK